MEKAAAAFINAAEAANTWLRSTTGRVSDAARLTHNPSPTTHPRTSLYYRYKSKLKLRAAANRS